MSSKSVGLQIEVKQSEASKKTVENLKKELKSMSTMMADIGSISKKTMGKLAGGASKAKEEIKKVDSIIAKMTGDEKKLLKFQVEKEKNLVMLGSKIKELRKEYTSLNKKSKEAMAGDDLKNLQTQMVNVIDKTKLYKDQIKSVAKSVKKARDTEKAFQARKLKETDDLIAKEKAKAESKLKAETKVKNKIQKFTRKFNALVRKAEEERIAGIKKRGAAETEAAKELSANFVKMTSDQKKIFKLGVQQMRNTQEIGGEIRKLRSEYKALSTLAEAAFDEDVIADLESQMGELIDKTDIYKRRLKDIDTIKGKSIKLSKELKDKKIKDLNAIAKEEARVNDEAVKASKNAVAKKIKGLNAIIKETRKNEAASLASAKRVTEFFEKSEEKRLAGIKKNEAAVKKATETELAAKRKILSQTKVARRLQKQFATSQIKDVAIVTSKINKLQAGYVKLGKRIKKVGDAKSLLKVRTAMSSVFKELKDLQRQEQKLSRNVDRTNKKIKKQTRFLGKLRESFGSLIKKGASFSTVIRRIGGTMTSLKVIFATLGLTSVAKGLIDVGVQMESTRATMLGATGSTKEMKDAMRLATAIATNYGLELTSTAQALGRYLAALKGTILEGRKGAKVFVSLAKTARVLGFTAERTKGIVFAFEQMLSKGTVTSEELKRQLGDRLPGAFKIAADAMGWTTEKLAKMMEQGRLMSEEFLPKFAKRLEWLFAKKLKENLRTASAAIGRWKANWQLMLSRIFESDLKDMFINALEAMTTRFMKFQVIGKKVGDSIAAGIRRGISLAGKSIDALSAVVRSLFRNSNKAGGKVADNMLTGITGFIELLGSLFTEILVSMNSFVEQVKQIVRVISTLFTNMMGVFAPDALKKAISDTGFELRGLQKRVEEFDEARGKLVGNPNPKSSAMLAYALEGREIDKIREKIGLLQRERKKLKDMPTGRMSFFEALKNTYAEMAPIAKETAEMTKKSTEEIRDSIGSLVKGGTKAMKDLVKGFRDLTKEYDNVKEVAVISVEDALAFFKESPAAISKLSRVEMKRLQNFYKKATKEQIKEVKKGIEGRLKLIKKGHEEMLALINKSNKKQLSGIGGKEKAIARLEKITADKRSKVVKDYTSNVTNVIEEMETTIRSASVKTTKDKIEQLKIRRDNIIAYLDEIEAKVPASEGKLAKHRIAIEEKTAKVIQILRDEEAEKAIEKNKEKVDEITKQEENFWDQFQHNTDTATKLVESSFVSLRDHIASQLVNMKLDFKSFADFVISTFTKMIAQIAANQIVLSVGTNLGLSGLLGGAANAGVNGAAGIAGAGGLSSTLFGTAGDPSLIGFTNAGLMPQGAGASTGGLLGAGGVPGMSGGLLLGAGAGAITAGATGGNQVGGGIGGALGGMAGLALMASNPLLGIALGGAMGGFAGGQFGPSGQDVAPQTTIGVKDPFKDVMGSFNQNIAKFQDFLSKGLFQEAGFNLTQMADSMERFGDEAKIPEEFKGAFQSVLDMAGGIGDILGGSAEGGGLADLLPEELLARSEKATEMFPALANSSGQLALDLLKTKDAGTEAATTMMNLTLATANLSEGGLNTELAQNAADFALQASMSGEATEAWTQDSVKLAIALNQENVEMMNNLDAMSSTIDAIAAVDERTSGLANASKGTAVAQKILGAAALYSAEEIQKASAANERLTEIQERQSEITKKLGNAHNLTTEEIDKLRGELIGLSGEASSIEKDLAGMTKGTEDLGDKSIDASDKISGEDGINEDLKEMGTIADISSGKVDEISTALSTLSESPNIVKYIDIIVRDPNNGLGIAGSSGSGSGGSGGSSGSGGSQGQGGNSDNQGGGGGTSGSPSDFSAFSPNITINVQGSVLSENDLVQTINREISQINRFEHVG